MPPSSRLRLRPRSSAHPQHPRAPPRAPPPAQLQAAPHVAGAVGHLAGHQGDCAGLKRLQPLQPRPHNLLQLVGVVRLEHHAPPAQPAAAQGKEGGAARLSQCWWWESELGSVPLRSLWVRRVCPGQGVNCCTLPLLAMRCAQPCCPPALPCSPADARVQALGQVHGVGHANDAQPGALAPWPVKQVVQHRLRGRVGGWVKWLGGAQQEGKGRNR